ncbi:major antigen isoform X2 [Plutella xylostella]|uniref:major antigen isoform X2 n=1 Tax=Plutella xylostella TaxID=51655 RepID=UPI002032F4F3|nr:major antigen isoform X2 [Plutella xylostella]
MSFITKRERVFDEFEQFELPARNEGKLKAYGSCTDARAWSHFCSDKTENLVDIIKRNNTMCTHKYIPTKVIVETLMAARNAEVSRLKRRIRQLELMLASYHQLDLTEAQKSEIDKAHEEIKAANKDLDELHLDLNLSGFTEGIDSEAYETGKSRTAESARSRGDDTWSLGKGSESRACQNESCAVSVSTQDPRINEMEQTIITKDAKLNAMKNTLAVMENDVCEPYCIYAHIYIALEKILRILCQHEKYKEYIDLLTDGKDARFLDIKEKIMFKIKVLQRFSLALVAPCTSECKEETSITCSCNRNDNVRVELALTAPEMNPVTSTMENQRAQLVADIMENEDIKDILIKSSTESIYKDSENYTKPNDTPVSCCIDSDNLARLKQLQLDYEDLIQCYENLKHERICLLLRCTRYKELEFELDNIKMQFKEYNGLWNEKEYYKNRSDETDQLKEKYYVLYDETKNLEMQLKAECEKNKTKTNTITELRNENIALEKKLNDTSITFEKETSALQCKLKESECKVMCLEEQIKCLKVQIDNILEHERDKLTQILHDPITLQNEIKQLKEQCKLENYEKETIQEQFHDQLNLINELKNEIEDWKGSYERILCRNEYLESDLDKMQQKMNHLIEHNRNLSDDLDEKKLAADNLRNIITNKSLEINKLITENESRRAENKELLAKFQETLITHSNSIVALERTKTESENSLQTAKQENQDLANKLKKYEEKNQQIYVLTNEIQELKDNLAVTAADNARLYKICSNLEEIENKKDLYEDLQNRLQAIIKENKHLNDNNITLQECMKKMKEEHDYKIMELKQEIKQYEHIIEKNQNEVKRLSDDKNNLMSEKKYSNTSLEAAKRQTQIIENQLSHFDNLSKDQESLKMSHENNLQTEKEQLVKKHTENEALKIELQSVKQLYQNLEKEKQQNLIDTEALVLSAKEEIHNLKLIANRVPNLEDELETINKKYTEQKNRLDEIVESNTNESTLLKNDLEKAQQRIKSLIDENSAMVEKFNLVDHEIQKQMAETEKTKEELMKAKQTNDEIKEQNNRLQLDIASHIQDLNCATQEADTLRQHSNELFAEKKILEESLITCRNQLIQFETTQDNFLSVQKELEYLKNERLNTHKKINGLLDELDQSKNKILDFKDDISARDDTIAFQQNHINDLNIQVRELLTNLGQLVEASESSQDINRQKADLSVKKIEAHHSKATHNMKMELDNLKQNHVLLENKLTHSRRVSDESLKDQEQITMQFQTLLNEREIIVTGLKELELKCTGHSLLSPNRCQIDDIIASINNIRNALDKRTSELSSLEQKLTSVQSSSKLLQSKTDAAQRIFEIEKQKIHYEKEEAIKNRLTLENKIVDLKNSLDTEIAQGKKLLQEKEVELLNQKFIIEQINKSSQAHIKELEGQLHHLQHLYDDAQVKIKSLEVQIQNISDENIKKINEIGNLLKEKSAEVTTLQDELSKMNQIKSLIHISTEISKTVTDMSTQTHNFKEEPIKLYPETPNIPTLSLDEEKILPQKLPSLENEVKILTSQLVPDLDHKYKRLSPGLLEQHSIPSREETSGINSRHSPSENDFKENKVTNSNVVRDLQSHDRIIPNVVQNKHGLNNIKSLGEIEKNNVLKRKDANSLYSPSTSNEENLFVFRKDSEISFKSNTSNLAEYNINNNVIVIPDSIYESRTEKDIEIEKEDNNINYHHYNKKKSDHKYTNIIDPEIEKKLPHINIHNSSMSNKLDLNKSSKNLSTNLAILPASDRTLADLAPSDHLVSREENSVQHNLGLQFILKDANNSEHSYKIITKNKSIDNLFSDSISSNIDKIISSSINSIGNNKETSEDKSVLVKIDSEYEGELKRLSKAFEYYKTISLNNMEFLKSKYDNHSKSIMNEHNEGVKNMQGSKTRHDIINVHENEVETLRSMSIEAMKKTDTVENDTLKHQLGKNSITSFEKGTVNIQRPSRRNCVSLDRTELQALDARSASHGPCTCSVDDDVTDTIRTIFHHVQSEMVEKTYLKNLGTKLINDNIESLTLHELSFLHLQVCRMWKSKYTKEEALQKSIDMLRKEVMNKQRLAHEHIAELDRKVAEETRLLQMRREAACAAQGQRPTAGPNAVSPAARATTIDRDVRCNCSMVAGPPGIKERLSAGDLFKITGHKRRPKRVKMDAPKATPGRVTEDRREKRNYNDEPPTRLRSTPDRSRPRNSKK